MAANLLNLGELMADIDLAGNGMKENYTRSVWTNRSDASCLWELQIIDNCNEK